MCRPVLGEPVAELRGFFLAPSSSCSETQTETVTHLLPTKRVTENTESERNSDKAPKQATAINASCCSFSASP
ncbi:unnamed protein product [Caretta caretta]